MAIFAIVDSVFENFSDVLIHCLYVFRPKVDLTCEQLDNFWRGRQYAGLQTVKPSKIKSMKGIITKRGSLEKLFHPKTYSILTREVHVYT